jgi:anion transporter
MIMAMAANNICSTAFLTATVPNPISASYIRNASNVDLGWLEWFQMALPLTLILLFSSWLLCSWMFKPEVKPSKESLESIREFRKSLGSFDSGEVLVAVLFTFSLILWITERFHGLNAGLISLFISLLLFAPKIGVIKMDKFAKGVPYGSITLFAASMFLAKGVGRWGALDPVAEGIFEFFSLSRLSLVLFISLAIVLSMLLHVVFTSTTVYATVIVPLSLSLAGLQGLEPQTLAIPIAFLTPLALILPVNTIPNVIFHSSGYFT